MYEANAVPAGQMERMNHTEQQFAAIEQYSEILQSIITQLEQRLNPVLRPEGGRCMPDKSATKEPTEAVLAPLAGRLREVASGIKGTGERISDILRNLEI